MSDNWRDGLPRSVLDPFGPRGEVIITPADRRWLWHVESLLAVAATNDYLRDLGRALTSYLHETCAHHWNDLLDCADLPIRQCLWCNVVEDREAVPS